MRTNTDLFVLITGVGLFYWGLKIIIDEGKKLDNKFVELQKQQNIMGPIKFLLMLSPFALSYIFIGLYPQFAVEALLFALISLFVLMGAAYLMQVRKLLIQGYPSSYINKFRMGQVLINIGILLIVGMQLARLVQTYG